ncbi:MAG: SRPBCC domain-containing protein [Pseudolabrys sp.]
MVIAAPIDRVWSVLLDPKIMAGCVPGVQSVDVLSDTEYLATIKVKISFISANFKIKTTILETKPPHYLRCEGTGEDSTVASTVKQTSEMFLTSQPDGATELRVKAKADVFGRLGSFGLSVMKTKADRMWEEFGDNLAAVLRQPASAASTAAVDQPKITPAQPAAVPHAAPLAESTRQHAARGDASPQPAPAKWWSRLLPQQGQTGETIQSLRLPTDIYVEVRRSDDIIKVLWPATAAPEMTTWLKTLLAETRR